MKPEKIPPPRPRGRPSRKGEIIAAAERLLRENGLAATTTRAIAESVPCSEAAIYVHFEDRLALILAVLEESLPAMLIPLHRLKNKVGQGSVEANLASVVRGLLDFHSRVMIMLCAVVGEPELRDRFRQTLAAAARGPEKGIGTIARYIEAEQKLRRISPQVDARSAARALVAGSFLHAFTAELLGKQEKLNARGLVRTVIRSGSS